MTDAHHHAHHGHHADEIPFPPPPPTPERPRVFAFDMDGVIYRGPDLIDGAAEAVATVRHVGLPVYFITNNSRETPVELAGKLQRLGIDAGPEDVVSAVVATVEYLRRRTPRPARVLVLGGDGLEAEIRRAGFELATWDGGDAPDVVVSRRGLWLHLRSSQPRHARDHARRRRLHRGEHRSAIPNAHRARTGRGRDHSGRERRDRRRAGRCGQAVGAYVSGHSRSQRGSPPRI